MKLVMTIRKNKYTVIIGILLLFRAMQYIPTYCSDYIGFQYLLSYKYGFISRGFVGSLLESIDFLSKGRLYFICLLVEISVTLLYLYFVHKVLKFLEGRKGVIVFVGICIFTLSPASIAYTYVINNFGRFDAILISIAILQSVILSYSSWKTGIAACVLSAIGIMIHPVFVFLYSPVAEVILLYKVFFTGEKEERKKWILFFILNTLIIIVMFSIFHFMAFISERYTLESLYNALQKRTDIDLTNCKVHLNDWYFSSAGELVNSAVRPFKSQMFTITFTMIFMFPYLYSLFTIWKKAMEVQKKSAGKLFCFIAGLSSLTSLPCFILEIDYGRWTASIFICQFIILMYLILMKDENIWAGITDLVKRASQHPVLADVLILYMVNLGVFYDITTLTISGNVYNLGNYILSLFR